MTDDRPPMPPQPTTKEIHAVSVPANAMEAVLFEIRGMRGDVQDVRDDVTMLVGQGRAFSKWRGEMEEWRATVDGAISRNSSRVKEPSSHDLQTAAVVAGVITAQQALGAKVDSIETMLVTNNAATAEIKLAVTGFLKKHPSIVASIATLLTTAIGAATAWFAAKGH